MITVFTPTYNRAHTLDKVFGSLKSQTYKDFEWLIIDDGSSDDTKSVVEKFRSDDIDFDIVYIYKENGGKHTAMNVAGDRARGELLVICDSDDWLADDALEKIIFQYEKIKSNEKIAGIIGRCVVFNRADYFEEKKVDFEYLDIPYHKKSDNNIYGEDTFAFKTAIFKKYKFPEIKEERYLAESIQLNMMYFDGYVFRFVNEIYKYGSYLEDGLTFDYKKVNHNNPRGYALWRVGEEKVRGIHGLKLAKVYMDYRAELEYRYSDKEIASFLNIPLIYLKLIVLVYKLKNIGKKKNP